MKQILRLVPPLVTLVVSFLATTQQAEARRGIVLITHGETIKHSQHKESAG